ncbi:MAG: polysaccharide deacetylase family protein [Rikenellaceae bacterium]
MRFIVPLIIRRIFPSLIWNFKNKTSDDTLHLTFDDGPTPEVTTWVLDCLKKSDVKATFFCLAKNVEQYPAIFNRIVAEGHSVGNHSYSHQKGWGMSTGRYVADVDLADDFINSNLYRPPYGRITPRQAHRLSERYKLIMWDVLSCDYSGYCSSQRCLKNVLNGARNGSIIVFHDSEKAFKNLSYALPRAIEELKSRGFKFEKIEL